MIGVFIIFWFGWQGGNGFLSGRPEMGGNLPQPLRVVPVPMSLPMCEYIFAGFSAVVILAAVVWRYS